MNKLELLQRQNAELRREVNRLQGLAMEQRRAMDERDKVLVAFQTEIQSINRILWSAAHSIGGRLTIPDASLQMAMDHTSYIYAYRDPKNPEMVIEAKVKTQSEGESDHDQQERVGNTSSGNGGNPEENSKKHLIGPGDHNS